MGKSRKFQEIDLSMLCHQLSIVLKSGMHPVEGIPLITEDIKNPFLKQALQLISEEHVHGTPLYKAFGHAGGFPLYMVAMIRVGEQTGMLETVMEELSNFYENEADIKKKIRSAVSYPIILAVLMMGVIALIAVKVIPMFVDILTSLGGEIPSQVNLFIAIGNAFTGGFVSIIAIILILIIIFILLSRLKQFRFLMDKLKLVSPIIGGTYKKIIASRFSNALSLTLKNGMNVSEGFQVVSGVLENRYVILKAQEAALSIAKGNPFSESIRKTGLFPELFIRLIKTGEKTGNLDAMMKKISNIYKEEVDTSLRRIVSYIEPVCVTALSLILAGVLLSVILPLISIMSSIG